MNSVATAAIAAVLAGAGLLAPASTAHAQAQAEPAQAEHPQPAHAQPAHAPSATSSSAVIERPHAARDIEPLDRGLVALPTSADAVFLSWRLLASDDPALAFNLYRTRDTKRDKLNPVPLSAGTNFTDTTGPRTEPIQYELHPVIAGVEQACVAATPLAAGFNSPFLEIPIDPPAGYMPNDASVADLDGDGAYDIVIHLVGTGHDNSHAGQTTPPILDAYTLSGKKLWRINLGRNIREGAHYTQFMVFDLDGDGRAELACKTADGTTDGTGKVIGDADADYRNADGHVIAGPEFLTVFDGRTGAARATTGYLPARHPTHPLAPTGEQLKSVWGDNYGNRSERYLAAVAYLDGVHPSLVMCRGYYTRTVLAAWDFRDDKLTSRWVFDSADGHPDYAGQGNHNLSVADVDDDGRDEIVYGGMTIDDNGQGLYSTGLGHGDAMHVGDFNPDNPGLEMVRIQERFSDAGLHMTDARTGRVLWKIPSVKANTTGGDKGEGPGRGVCFDIDPRFPGSESWASGAGMTGVFDCHGQRISDAKLPVNMAVYWDADPQRELLDGTGISKWDWTTDARKQLLNAADHGCIKINGTKSNPCLSADILGDWREEVIWPTADGKALRIFSTTIPTDTRLPTLMSDRQYRLSIAWQNVAYNQPPHVSYEMGR